MNHHCHGEFFIANGVRQYRCLAFADSSVIAAAVCNGDQCPCCGRTIVAVEADEEIDHKDLTRLLSMQAIRNMAMLKRDAKRLKKKSLQVFGTEYPLMVCQKAMAVSRGFTSFAQLEVFSAKLGLRNLEVFSEKLGLSNPSLAVQTTVPITEIEVYRAMVEACVKAEVSDQLKLALVLRAWVDGSPFHSCPNCDGRAPWRNEPPCKTCNGDGFVPDSN